MNSNEEQKSEQPNNDEYDLNQRQNLLNFIKDEIRRNSDFGKWSGITFLGIIVLLVALLKYSFDQIIADNSGFQLLLEIVAGLFVVFNALIFFFIIYSYLSGIRKFKPPIKLLSTISEYRIISETKIEIAVAALVLILNFLLLLLASCYLNNTWIIYASSGWLILKGVLLLIGITSRKTILNSMGIVSPNYTLLIAVSRKVRIKTFIILMILEFVNIFILVWFIQSNSILFSLANVDKIIPIVVSTFGVIGLLMYLIKLMIQLRIVNRLRIIEFHVLKYNLGAKEMLEVLEETYTGRTIPEWINDRFKRYFAYSKEYFDNEVAKVDACRRVLVNEEKTFQEVIATYLALAAFKKYDQIVYLQYLAETIIHLSVLEESGLLDEFEAYDVGLLNLAIEKLNPSVENVVKEVDDYLNKMSNCVKSLEPHANHPLDN